MSGALATAVAAGEGICVWGRVWGMVGVRACRGSVIPFHHDVRSPPPPFLLPPCPPCCTSHPPLPSPFSLHSWPRCPPSPPRPHSAGAHSATPRNPVRRARLPAAQLQGQPLFAAASQPDARLSPTRHLGLRMHRGQQGGWRGGGEGGWRRRGKWRGLLLRTRRGRRQQHHRSAGGNGRRGTPCIFLWLRNRWLTKRTQADGGACAASDHSSAFMHARTHARMHGQEMAGGGRLLNVSALRIHPRLRIPAQLGINECPPACMHDGALRKRPVPPFSPLFSQLPLPAAP